MRKNLIKPLKYPAWLVSGGGTPRRKCKVDDISKSGASLTMETADSLPHLFLLHLSDAGTEQRRCRRSWQDRARVGVDFVGLPPRISDVQSMRQRRDIVHEYSSKAGSKTHGLQPFDLDTLKSWPAFTMDCRLI